MGFFCCLHSFISNYTYVVNSLPNRSKQKGDREERSIVNLHRALGFTCERTLESGKRSDGSDPWDITIETPIGELRGECKVSKSNFKMLYDWIAKGDDVDFLTIRRDGEERLYVLPERLWEKFLVTLKDYEGKTE